MRFSSLITLLDEMMLVVEDRSGALLAGSHKADLCLLALALVNSPCFQPALADPEHRLQALGTFTEASGLLRKVRRRAGYERVALPLVDTAASRQQWATAAAGTAAGCTSHPTQQSACRPNHCMQAVSIMSTQFGGQKQCAAQVGACCSHNRPVAGCAKSAA